MDKIVIKDLASFCSSKKSLKGTIEYNLGQIIESLDNHPTIYKEQVMIVSYDFSGSQSGEKYYLNGSWNTVIKLKCSVCREELPLPLSQDYQALRLLDENSNSLESAEEGQECRFDFFDLAPWIFSEVMIAVPLAPKHEECSSIDFETIISQ